nr:hypothetical protein [Mammaliicoccus sp. Marseille-Q6498]
MTKSITLEINGEEKKFHRENIKGRQARKGINLTMKVSALANDMKVDEIDKFDDLLDQCEEFIVNDLYGKQFTKDELLDGVDGDKYVEFLMEQVAGTDETSGKKK